MVQRKYPLTNLFVLVCSLTFAYLFYLNFHMLSRHEWVVIVTLVGIAALFEIRFLEMPSGGQFSLISSLLFTAGVLYGSLTVFFILLFWR
ncbi:hypothetical protein skT53_20190 [Effusibacillus dendaii]|uniref:Uncharacterized protein n=1 Tax=Effusibacillus dendaii TaxID=2743772 RepID=A0A7I8DA94_9BACL|nr:hypothetical protein skT53_20190 [Effusibacillus dendaii]